jgi:hypothetical protein
MAPAIAVVLASELAGLVAATGINALADHVEGDDTPWNPRQ